MNKLYNEFLIGNKDLAGLYDETMLSYIFKLVRNFIRENDTGRISETDVIRYVNTKLKQEQIGIINSSRVIKPILRFLMHKFGYSTDLYKSHLEDTGKIIWKSLSQYVSNAGDYLPALTIAILNEFASCEHDISTQAITDSVRSCPDFELLPAEALHHTINEVFEYFIDIGFIEYA